MSVLIVGTRLCEGCDLPIPNGAHRNQRFHNARCKKAARRREEVRRSSQMLLPGPRAGRNARSGLQVSYAKALAALQAGLASYVTAQGVSEEEARQEIADVLATALSEKQRARLEARS